MSKFHHQVDTIQMHVIRIAQLEQKLHDLKLAANPVAGQQDAKRFRLFATYLVGNETDCDEAFCECNTVEELRDAIDEHLGD